MSESRTYENMEAVLSSTTLLSWFTGVSWLAGLAKKLVFRPANHVKLVYSAGLWRKKSMLWLLAYRSHLQETFKSLSTLTAAHYYTVVSLFHTLLFIPTEPCDWSVPLVSSSSTDPFSVPFGAETVDNEGVAVTFDVTFSGNELRFDSFSAAAAILRLSLLALRR